MDRILIDKILPTQFIAKHLNKKSITLQGKSVNTICKMCGKQISEWYESKKIIKSNFTDYEYLKFDSNYLCINCVNCMSAKIQNHETGKYFLLVRVSYVHE